MRGQGLNGGFWGLETERFAYAQLGGALINIPLPFQGPPRVPSSLGRGDN